MLHLVPALLILLLQGPGGLERLAHDARYPEAVTLLRSMGLEHTAHHQGATHSGLTNASPAVVLNAIRTSKQDFGKVLAVLAGLIDATEAKTASEPIQGLEDSQDPPIQRSAVGRVHDGFIANSRTRDGPR